MVVTGLVRLGARRPKVLPVVPAGATRARLAVERELRVRGWPAAVGPADCDVLAVCGWPGPDLAAAARRVWAQVPVPKVWVGVPTPVDAGRALDLAVVTLADLAAQRRTAAAERVAARQESRDHRPERGAGHGEEDGGQGGEDGGQGGEHGGHGGMAMPGGLMMAERGPDRDGLSLDRLHVALGPVLPDWPAGLALHLVLQGDVVQEARAELLDPDPGRQPDYWDAPWRLAAAGAPVTRAEAARRVAAADLDSLARLLAVAGWDGAALAGRWLRDDLLAGEPAGQVAPRFARFRRRVGRSRLLRWMTTGIGRLDPAAAAAFGLDPPAGGGSHSDVVDRLQWWLDRTGHAMARLDDDRPLVPGRAADPLARPPRRAGGDVDPLALLADLVVGAELAATRLIVASLDPGPQRWRERGHG